MPATQPRTLKPDQVYALVAYIFVENKLIGEADVMNAETLPKVKTRTATTSSSGFRIGFECKAPTCVASRFGKSASQASTSNANLRQCSR